jgi:hypothetical protein
MKEKNHAKNKITYRTGGVITAKSSLDDVISSWLSAFDGKTARYITLMGIDTLCLPTRHTTIVVDAVPTYNT